MTNKENVEATNRSSQMAATLAMHLVGQVLDEACIIVNAANELGQPWRSISILNKVNINRSVEGDEENSSLIIEMGDNDDGNIRHVSHTMTTSTPQKLTDETKWTSKNDTCIIGQGDEGIDSEQDALQEQNDLSKSTSTFINRLFDMSDVEYIHGYGDDTQRTVEGSETLTEEIINIVTSCVESAFNLTYVKESPLNNNLDDTSVVLIETSKSSQNSSYSFLNDALSNNIARNIALQIDDVATNSKVEICHPINMNFENEEINVNIIEQNERNDIESYENAYVTLNRDYEQYSDEEEIRHQDTKYLALQDVELSCGKRSSVVLPDTDKIDYKDLATTSAVSASAVSRKSSLVRRCRLQGSRLLSCLRGWWWRRKLPGRHKVPRMPGAVRGHCPLSPSTKIRTGSLLDNRIMRSPSPGRPVVWKFNTINETMVNSAHWNKYLIQAKPDGEHY